MKRKITLLLLVLLFTSINLNAQLTDLVEPNKYSEFEIYMDSDSLWYSTSITVQFKGRTIELPAGATNASTSDIIKPNTRNILQSVKQKYGNFRLEKVFKNSSWGDTLGVDRNTGRQVNLRNLSQFYKIIFDELICVDSLINELKVFPEIVSADRPSIVTLHYVPSDYSAAEQWSLDRIGATRAWDITTGNEQVKIAVVDFFERNDLDIHNELQGKISYNPENLSKDHGQIVAGAIAAHTDNGTGIASIGFNSKVMLFEGNTASAVNNALNAEPQPEIINCS